MIYVGKEPEREWLCVYVKVNHFVEPQTLVQLNQLPLGKTLKKKKKKRKAKCPPVGFQTSVVAVLSLILGAEQVP